MRRSPKAYPGSMLVYTAAKTYGLHAATAQDVAQFIRVSSTEGQHPGRGNGQLAAGYVPITSSGVTKPLYHQAQQVAAAVAAQQARAGVHQPLHEPDVRDALEGAPPSVSGPPSLGGPPLLGGPPGALPDSAPPASSPSTRAGS